MIKKITISSLLILTIFINSCSVGYSVDRTFTPLITLNCETMPENVALFFEGEKIDYKNVCIHDFDNTFYRMSSTK